MGGGVEDSGVWQAAVADVIAIRRAHVLWLRLYRRYRVVQEVGS